VLFVALFASAVALAGGIAAGCGGASAESAMAHRELPPADPRAVAEFNRGNSLMDRNRVAPARAHFEKALQIDPNLWEAHYNIGVLDREAGELRRAIQRFERARAIQPGASQPLLALAEAFYTIGEADEAADLLRTFVESEPGAIEARIALATILREEEDYDDALEQAREALIRDSSNVPALIEVGRVYRARAQYDVAELVFRKALELAGDDGAAVATLHNDLGLVSLARGDTQAAFLEFQRAIEADARFTPARMNQGSVLLRAGDYQGATAEYRAALRVDDRDLEAHVALGIALRGAGQHQEARRAYEHVLAAAPNHPGALLNLAILKAEFLDQRPQSRSLFQRYLEVAPTNAPEREMAERYLQEIPAAGQGGAAPGGAGRSGGGG
jgi:tetratricopeptide (TPR) repeat protein